MEKRKVRAEILLKGLVQGVGFRWFVLKKAGSYSLKGYVKNLYTGEVLIVAEGQKYEIEDFFREVKIGPQFSSVNNASINWLEYKNEFKGFEVKY
ncbi:acylphosphatase [Bacteroidota bacterium]